MEIGGEPDLSNSEAPTTEEQPEGSTRLESSGKRQIKKNDNGDCDEKSDSSCDESFKKKKMNGGEPMAAEKNTRDTPKPPSLSGKGDAFPKVQSNFRHRNYRSHSLAENAIDVRSSDEEGVDAKRRSFGPLETNPQDPDPGPEAGSSDPALNVDDTSNKNPLPAYPPDYSPLTNFKKLKQLSRMKKNSGVNKPVMNKRRTQVMGRKRKKKHSFIKTTIEGNRRGDNQFSLSSSTSSSSCSDSSTSVVEDRFETLLKQREHLPIVLLKKRPKHKWFATPEIVNRQIGFSNRKQGSELFQQRMYGSLHCVQRLELMYKLEAHTGCVNSLNFNQTGTLLVSGSDDLQICMWDWPMGKLLTAFDTGHKSNVFQAKFLPLIGDTHLATCGRDGQVRLVELASNGQLRATRKIAQHRGPAHKLATQGETPLIFLSCGEDGRVMSHDIRLAKPAKVMLVKDGPKRISLYSVHSNPLNSSEFVVCGRHNFLRIYDQRNTTVPKSEFCPQHLRMYDPLPHVTCAMFSYNGTELLASYNDEDIYLFDTRQTGEGCDFVHRYQGHRNSATVKGVNFFGPKSEFVVSGSDCGNIFFWDKEAESIVQWMAGDENGVVNCLEPHPEIPVLASSGLDEDVKIWVPSCEQEPTFEGLKKTVISNIKNRNVDPVRSADTFDGEMLWILWRHISRNERQQRQRARMREGGRVQDFNESSEESSSTSDDEDGQGQGHRLQCSPS